jgi:DNA-binding IclR family transcriptional regulator
VASVSAPIFGAPGVPGIPVAAISVSAPEGRLGPSRARTTAPAVIATAREVEAALAGGYQA